MKAVAILLAAVAGFWLWLAASPRPALLDGVPFSSVVLDRHGGVLRLGLAVDGRYRLRVTLADIAPEAVQATLVYEDRFFFSHPGVNPLSLVRAALTTLTGERRVGGSTLTMQVVRLRQGLGTTSPAGKLVQILRALQLEYHYSKEEILEAYCNLAPYGGNVEGLGAAARVYFHKEARRLSSAESLALAGVPQNPTRRRPPSGPDFHEARARLTRLVSGNEKAAPPPLRIFGTADLPFAAPHVSEELLGQIRQAKADNQSGQSGQNSSNEQNGKNGQKGPVAGDPERGTASPGIIRTTLDPAAQRELERLLRHFTERGRLYGLDNAAGLLVHWPSMEIRALAGSADFSKTSIQGQVDGTRARRSPGSTLKPFVYALALEQGLIHPLSLLADSPRSFGGYDPENFDRSFRGPLSAREALLASRNIPAISLASRLRSPGLYGFLQRAGVEMPFPEEHYGLSLVLGGAETSMRDLARLYAMLANQGLLRELVLDADASPPPPRRLLAPEAAFLTLSMLENEEDTVPGRRGSLPLRCKTGTSNGFRDAWCAGVFGPYVLVVWVGNFDNRSNPLLIGGEVAAPLFRDIATSFAMREDLSDLLPAQAERLRLTTIPVCSATGDTDTSLCTETTPSWFWPGVSPVRSTGVFRRILVDKETGLRACSPLPGRTEEVLWEFWPSDLRRLFLRAGIVKPAPPPFDLAGPTCAPQALPTGMREETGAELPEQKQRADAREKQEKPVASVGRDPEILSPKEGVSYHVRLSDPQRTVIPLLASVDADAEAVFWFAATRFLGRTAPGESLPWQPPPGLTELRVVDSQGRSAVRRLFVETVP